ncbi:MAG: hypothetical protein KBC12_00935 [Candidatus Pacebacteria bacterium]|jgi:hypothetical protein|nr:hypothetical protein [Candidatus Paceibacterota bacterium]MBP9851496.1 hypothetical protein [Candidatus Paceibacterota bacterium]
MNSNEVPKKLIIPGEKLEAQEVKLEVPPVGLILPKVEIIKPPEPEFKQDQKIILPGDLQS